MGGVQRHGVPGLKPLVVLGATGSIGTQTLEVADRLGIEVDVVAARQGSEALLRLAEDRPSAHVVVAAPTREERQRFAAFAGRVDYGPEAVVAAAARAGRTVVNGIVGSAGLAPSVAALEAGNRLALANKESLVAGGPVLLAALEKGGGELVPIDSEHSALAQLLAADDRGVERVVLTASGGPFRGMSTDQLADATPTAALAHPTWEMGRRISVDSATLMNKGFEVIEAHFLFDLAYDQIDVVVHPQSVVHAIVAFIDGSMTAHLGDPDMRVPIQSAITWPEREAANWGRLALDDLELRFEAPDRQAFPCLDLAYAAGEAGGSSPAVLNAADEIAVEAFLTGRIGFASIPVVVAGTLEQVAGRPVATVEDVLDVDEEARAVAWDVIGSAC
jgi:1-deoxy-D-xylulose-5-phosphate reductoisomerase